MMNLTIMAVKSQKLLASKMSFMQPNNILLRSKLRKFTTGNTGTSKSKTKIEQMKNMGQRQQMNFLNQLYFHKRRIFVGSLFCTGYGTLCYNSRGIKSEAFRLGIAGSIATLVCECVFHIMDTVNIRMKVKTGDPSAKQRSTLRYVTHIYKNEGPYGFAKGISACFYGAIFSGFVYFFLYKKIKLSLYDYFEGNINPVIVFLLASMIAELCTIVVHFPYDLVKCRL